MDPAINHQIQQCSKEKHSCHKDQIMDYAVLNCPGHAQEIDQFADQ